MNFFRHRISRFKKTQRNRQLTKHLSASISKRIAKLTLILLCLVLVNSLAMIQFEGMTFRDAMWMSLTTITTVGYGDLSPSTNMGRIFTVISLYAFAISVLTLLISEVIEWRMVKSDKKRKGYWEWRNMKQHILIINSPNTDTEKYLIRLLREIHRTESIEDTPVKLLSRKFPNGLPQTLVDLKLLLRTGAAEDGETLQRCGIEQAEHIILLARDTDNTVSDSITYDVLCQIKMLNSKARIIAEAISDNNHQRFLDAGADVVIRPIRAYPELVVRAMVNPGTERVIEDLLSASGDSLYLLPVSFYGRKWLDIVTTVLSNDIGTPVAYMNGAELIMQPNSEDECNADALIVMGKQGCVDKAITLQKVLNRQ